jgi:hypothetical protein
MRHAGVVNRMMSGPHSRENTISVLVFKNPSGLTPVARTKTASLTYGNSGITTESDMIAALAMDVPFG